MDLSDSDIVICSRVHATHWRSSTSTLPDAVDRELRDAGLQASLLNLPRRGTQIRDMAVTQDHVYRVWRNPIVPYLFHELCEIAVTAWVLLAPHRRGKLRDVDHSVGVRKLRSRRCELRLCSVVYFHEKPHVREKSKARSLSADHEGPPGQPHQCALVDGFCFLPAGGRGSCSWCRGRLCCRPEQPCFGLSRQLCRPRAARHLWHFPALEIRSATKSATSVVSTCVGWCRPVTAK